METGQIKRLLIVEDEDDHYELILRGFEKETRDFVIERARTIKEADAVIDSRLPSLIITDWKLPDGEGISLIRKDGAGRCLSPVIVMTSFGNESWAVEAMKLGAMDYIVKSPDIFSYFPRIVRRVISEWENIEKRKKAEDALTQSEDQLMKIFNSMPVLMVISTISEGIVMQVNETFLNLLGYTKDEVIGKTAAAIGLYADPGQPESIIRHIIEENHVSDREIRIRKKNGDVLDTLFSAEIIELQKKRYILSVLNDVTGWRKATEEKSRLQEQLRQSQKMEAIGTLAGGIAHDFNNILSVIMGYGSLLEMNLDPSSQLREHVSLILSSAQKAAHLTNQILTFSRNQVLDLKVTDIKELISGLWKILHRLTGEKIQLLSRDTAEDITVMVDPGQLEQVLMNLCTNARDAMPEGGTLTISAGTVELDESFARLNGLDSPGCYAVISVADTGTGMDEMTRQKMFEPFFTTKEIGKGTGLGLSIVYGIIVQHRGCITAESMGGKGTTFAIYLPTVPRSAEETRDTRMYQPLHGTETVLIADDNESVRKLTSRVLKEFGYTVIEAVDGQDVIEKFKKHKNGIALVVLDAIMPKKNGRQARDEISRMKPGVKFLFLSGYPADVIESSGARDKGMHFISKPATSQDILTGIRAVLDEG